jgi:hypothetical protein
MGERNAVLVAPLVVYQGSLDMAREFPSAYNVGSNRSIDAKKSADFEKRLPKEKLDGDYCRVPEEEDSRRRSKGSSEVRANAPDYLETARRGVRAVIVHAASGATYPSLFASLPSNGRCNGFFALCDVRFKSNYCREWEGGSVCAPNSECSFTSTSTAFSFPKERKKERKIEVLSVIRTERR